MNLETFITFVSLEYVKYWKILLEQEWHHS